MFKQSAVSRNQRSKGFKVKLIIKTCLVLSITVWMIYQLKLALTHNLANGEVGEAAQMLEKEEMATGALNLGRKGLILTDSETRKSEETDQSSGGALDDDKSNENNGEEEEEDEQERIEDLVDGIDKDGDDNNEEEDLEVEQLDDQTEEDNNLQNGVNNANI